jgi:hypothetical protein
VPARHTQLHLQLPNWSEDTLAEHLRSLCTVPLEFRLTDNSFTMMTYKPPRRGRPAQLRAHRMFAGASQDVLDALAQWAMGCRERPVCKTLDEFVRANHHLVRRRPIHLAPHVTRGRFHDLRPHFDELNAEHFDNKIDAPITWGRFPAPKRQRSIRLGSYSADAHLIRIHPHLDQDFVPAFFVRYIIFHEMLHAQLGIKVSGTGRRCIHTPEFNALERAYPDYARAIAWNDNPANLRRLLRPAAKSA